MVIFLFVFTGMLTVYSINSRYMVLRELERLQHMFEGQAVWEEEKRIDLDHRLYALEKEPQKPRLRL
jgi:hypothetical protein